MTGIEATEEMTAEQLGAMSGGELLRSEVKFYAKKYFACRYLQHFIIFHP